MSVRYLSVLPALSALLSCQQAPNLEIRQNFSLSLRELADRSAVVLVGTPVSVESVGPRQQIGELVVRLCRIGLTVERVLKGDVPQSGSITFWRYVWSGDTLPKNAMSADFIAPGMRSVFFLDRESDNLRTTVDVVQSRLGVMEGDLYDRALKPETSVNEKISRLLLSPGINRSPESAAGSLANSAYYSIELIGKTRTAHLMRDLVSRLDGKAKISACLELSGRFPGQDNCLHELLQNAKTDMQARHLAEKQLATSLSRDTAIKIALRQDPEKWLAGHTRSRERADTQDELGLLAIHPDPEIHQIACETMLRDFPSEAVPECRTNK